MATRIYVDSLQNGTGGEYVTLGIQYAGKQAHIEIPRPKPLFDREPGVDGYRRGLQELLDALEEWIRSNAAIESSSR
jgi:hypothetical protein